jgi:hypothetical protein
MRPNRFVAYRWLDILLLSSFAGLLTEIALIAGRDQIKATGRLIEGLGAAGLLVFVIVFIFLFELMRLRLFSPRHLRLVLLWPPTTLAAVFGTLFAVGIDLLLTPDKGKHNLRFIPPTDWALVTLAFFATASAAYLMHLLLT